MKAAILLFALGLLGGRTNMAAPHGVEGAVRLGQVAYVGGPQVRPDRTVEDSRCPINARCVWAGRVVLRATLLSGRRPRQIDLTLGTPMRVADGMLTLISVEPGRATSEPIRPQQLRFTFAFQGGL